MTIDCPSYTAALALCLRDGHQPVRWRMGDVTRVLCRSCGRTWPQNWFRLISMPCIEPIEVAA